MKALPAVTASGRATRMKLGFFTMPIHPLEKDWRVSLQEDREAFILADELGFTEAYVGEHTTDRAENITSCIAFLAWIAAATKKIKLGTGTVNMPNTHPAATAASLAMLDHMLDGRSAVGCGSVRQSRRRSQRDVPRSDQPGARDLGERAALQHQGQILEPLGRAHADGRGRARFHRKALAAAASAHRGHGGRAVFQGRDRGRRAWLGADLGELPDAGLGEEPLAEICRGLRARRPSGRSCQLARC